MNSQLLNTALEFMSNVQAFQQLGLVILAFLGSILTKHLLQRAFILKVKGLFSQFIKRSQSDHNSHFNRFNAVLTPLLVYLTSVVWLSFAVIVSNAWIGESQLVQLTIQCFFVWILTTYVSLFSGNKIIGTSVGGIFIFGIILNHFDVLESVIYILEHYSISIGQIHISVFSILKFFFVLSILMWLSSILSRSGKKYIHAAKGLKLRTKVMLKKGLDVALILIVSVILLNSAGIDLTALTVIGGALGVGVGFGLQKITSNFVSGLILLFEKSIKIGDLIQIDDAIHGWIRQLGSRFTLIETFDGTEIMIPNDDFITSRVINWTYSNTRGRMLIDIGVSYDSDMTQVKNLLEKAAKEYEGVAETPPPVAYMKEFGDNAVVFTLSLFIKDSSHGLLLPKSDILFSIWTLFKKNNIIIPFPQRDIHIKERS